MSFDICAGKLAQAQETCDEYDDICCVWLPPMPQIEAVALQYRSGAREHALYMGNAIDCVVTSPSTIQPSIYRDYQPRAFSRAVRELAEAW